MSIELTEQDVEFINTTYSSFNIDTGITGEPGECVPGSEELLVVEGVRDRISFQLPSGKTAHAIHHVNGGHVSLFKITD
jgi:hypothetical protein